MADYKAMYLAAMDAMERAIETLTAAQQAARPAEETDDA